MLRFSVFYRRKTVKAVNLIVTSQVVMQRYVVAALITLVFLAIRTCWRKNMMLSSGLR